MSTAPLTLGTAGHIDHGKTALVRALTGVDTDRLPEEQARGMTIALGYAPLVLPSGRALSVVDVPGHERFVRTMVAGATGIDLFLMVLAADDGVMPQTREHAAVLRGLGIAHGVVAITKSDLADPSRAAAAAAELLPDVPIVACSARTGAGLDALRAALDRVAADVRSRAEPPPQATGGLAALPAGAAIEGDARPQAAGSAVAPSAAGMAGEGAVLHVDRAFVIDGRGTVVTGTLWRGTLRTGDAVVLHPGARAARIRGLQIHDHAAELARAGQRVAVNLSGVRARELGRGDVLSTDSSLTERTVLDCVLTLDGARHGERVHVHHGTRDVPARLAHLAEDLYQLRLDGPVLAREGEHVIVRRPSPPDTLGGGTILDAAARRHGRRPELLDALRARRDGGFAASTCLARGDAATPPPSSPPAELSAAALTLEERLRAAGAGFLAEGGLDAAALRELRTADRAVRVSGRLYGHADVVAALRDDALALTAREGSVSLAEARDALGLSRKAAQALLEHLDALRLTRRGEDDRRTLLRARA